MNRRMPVPEKHRSNTWRLLKVTQWRVGFMLNKVKHLRSSIWFCSCNCFKAPRLLKLRDQEIPVCVRTGKSMSIVIVRIMNSENDSLTTFLRRAFCHSQYIWTVSDVYTQLCVKFEYCWIRELRRNTDKRHIWFCIVLTCRLHQVLERLKILHRKLKAFVAKFCCWRVF